MLLPIHRSRATSWVTSGPRALRFRCRRAVTVAGLLCAGGGGRAAVLAAQARPAAEVPRPPGAAPAVRPGRPEALPSRLDYVPVERYEQIKTLVVRTGAEGGTLFNAPDGQTSYMLARRTTPSEVEEHSRWDDVIVVRSGTGAVEVGPRSTGARFAAPGELRGGTLAAPSRIVLRPGDIVRIPAGVPHAFVPGTAEPWEFLILKVRRPEKPLKRPPAAGR